MLGPCGEEIEGVVHILHQHLLKGDITHTTPVVIGSPVACTPECGEAGGFRVTEFHHDVFLCLFCHS